MPIRTDFVERAAFRTSLAPGVLLDFLGAQAFRAVCAAVELGLFEALREGARSPAEVAERLHASARGIRLLLEALEALGYVVVRNGRFAASPMTKKWLMEPSPVSLARGIPFFDSMVFDRWGHLAESIRRGEPVMNGYDWLDNDPKRWAAYEDAMRVLARTAAPEIVSKTNLPRAARRLLDIGGGHGLYAIEFCRRHKNLSAAIFDLPPALDAARRTIAEEKMSARVTPTAGDLRSDDFGSDYDVVLLFNILHGFGAEENATLLQRIGGAMNPGGVIVVLDQTPEGASGAVGRTLAGLQALNFFNDLGAETYTTDEICAWLDAAGYARCKRSSLRSMPGFSLITASTMPATRPARAEQGAL